MFADGPEAGGVVIPFPNSRIVEPEEPPRGAGAPADAPMSRGVETLFRSVYNTHLTLHSMADSKSRMMIQVDGLILSVLIAANSPLGGSLGGFDVGSAAVALTAAASISMVFAVLAARPRSRRRSPRTGRAQAGTGGLLFFSEFSGMSRDEYVAGMNALMQEPARLYESMSINLHTMGGLLERKYVLLRLSYGALALGVVAACLTQLRLGGLLASVPSY